MGCCMMIVGRSLPKDETAYACVSSYDCWVRTLKCCSPIDTRMPIQNPFHVTRGSGVLSYPSWSPTHREVCSTEFLRRHLLIGLDIEFMVQITKRYRAPEPGNDNKKTSHNSVPGELFIS